jgi:Holliday junction resolvase RusA-like endonuclease
VKPVTGAEALVCQLPGGHDGPHATEQRRRRREVGTMIDIIRFRSACVPPTATHHAKKVVRIKTRDGRQFTKLADTPELVKAKSTLDELLIPHQPSAPMPSPVVLTAVFVWPWLSSALKRDRLKGRIPHTSRPDASNCIKTLEDRLVQLRFLEDDNGVAELHVQKWWGDDPGIEVLIQPFGERAVLRPRESDQQDLLGQVLALGEVRA